MLKTLLNIFLGFMLSGCTTRDEIKYPKSTLALPNYDIKKNQSGLKDSIKLPKKVAVVNFQFNSSNLTTQERHHIIKTLNVLNRTSDDFKIIVKGHTDMVGDDKYNKQLGFDRALSVKKALINQGIKKNKIQVMSYGEEQPIVYTSEWIKSKINRRVIIEIVPEDRLPYSDSGISMN